MNIQQARRFGTKTLCANNTATKSSSPALDADVLLQHVLHCDKTFVLFHGEVVLSSEQESQFKSAIALRNTGLPIAYITKNKEFYGLDFFITPDVLIPKPDTELLVEYAVDVLKQKLAANPNLPLSVCDMCTGSGCVGISILHEIIHANSILDPAPVRMVLSDISEKALCVAQKNLSRLVPNDAHKHVHLVQGNLFSAVSGSFDLIVANPPYIPTHEVSLLLRDGRSEPILALNGDVDLLGNPSPKHDGLGIMQNLVPQAVQHLAPGGILAVETGEYNAEPTESLFKNAGLKNRHIEKDLSGSLRMVVGQKAE